MKLNKQKFLAILISWYTVSPNYPGSFVVDNQFLFSKFPFRVISFLVIHTVPRNSTYDFNEKGY